MPADPGFWTDANNSTGVRVDYYAGTGGVGEEACQGSGKVSVEFTWSGGGTRTIDNLTFVARNGQDGGGNHICSRITGVRPDGSETQNLLYSHAFGQANPSPLMFINASFQPVELQKLRVYADLYTSTSGGAVLYFEIRELYAWTTTQHAADPPTGSGDGSTGGGYTSPYDGADGHFPESGAIFGNLVGAYWIIPVVLLIVIAAALVARFLEW